MNIVIYLQAAQPFFSIKETHIQIIKSKLPQHNIHIISDMAECDFCTISDMDIYFGWDFPKEWISIVKKLKFVVIATAGTDHVPVEALAHMNIPVISGARYHGIPMTEQILLYILGFSRGIFQTFGFQHNKKWWDDDIQKCFFDIYGSVMTILGCGIIGKQLAKTVESLNIKTIGVRETIPDETSNIEWCTWECVEEALKRSTIVVNLLPLTKKTRGIVDKSIFEKMKGCKLFINVGRGETVQTDDLLFALNQGWLTYCALDVYDSIPSINSPLRNNNNVIMTPKTGVYFHDYMKYATCYFIKIVLTLEPFINSVHSQEELYNFVNHYLNRNKLWNLTEDIF